MTSVALPDLPVQTECKLSLLRFGGDLTSVLGGETQRLRRLGMRYSAYFALPTLNEDLAKQLIAARLYSDTEGVTIVAAYPQPPFTLPIGAPKIDGAGQTGTTIDIKGLTPRFFVQQGAAFSFNDGARNYLHTVVNVGSAVGADGTATIRVAPMLRVSPADGTALEFARPLIEGFINEAPTWDLSWLLDYGLTFTLSENK